MDHEHPEDEPAAADSPRRRRVSPLLAGPLVAVLTVAVAMGAGSGVALLDHRPPGEAERVGTGPYAFELTQPGTERPVTYDPCTPIRVAINPDGAPAGYQELVQQALDETSAASGFAFEVIGETDDTSYDSRVAVATPGREVDPVLIGWASADELPKLEGDVIGYGGSVVVQRRSGLRVLTSGAVALDRDAFAEMVTDDVGRARAKATIEHELGHLLGLGHVADPSQLMFPRQVGQTGFGIGDRAGLARLGAVGCR